MVDLRAADGSKASDFCFGTMQFGGTSTDADSADVYRQCRDAGVNFFDCAYAYNDGRSEEILGRLIAGERESLIITTKCAYPGGSGRSNILAQFDTSRKRMNSDYFDIYFLHRWDDDVDLHETIATLAELKAAGGIHKIGVSNFSAWQTMKAQSVANKLGVRIDVLQPMYNLVKRQVEVEILPMAQAEAFHVTPYSPLGGGLLTGKYLDGGGTGRIISDASYAGRYAPDWMMNTARNLVDLAVNEGVSPITLAVAWVKRNPAITAPIISGRTASQLAPSLDAMTFEIGDALYERLSALSPTPAPATDRLEEA
jgi:1-deoxyxylulose-5-phosphate synthase